MAWNLTFLTLIALSMGSFANTCIYRIPTGISLLSSRSHCPCCQNPLSWSELIPVVSYLALKGNCRYCRHAISWRYPLVELLTFALILICYLQFSLTIPFVLAAALICMLIPVIVIDWKHFLIPNVLLVAGTIFWVVVELLGDTGAITTGLLSGIVAFSGVGLIAFLGRKYFSRESLGWGDVKLAGVLGLYLSWDLFFLSLWLAALCALIYGIMRTMVNKHPFFGMKIPFGSFLGSASIAIFLLQDVISGFLLQWMSPLS